MATFSYTPSFDATEASKPRVVTFQAGDGYQQRVGFGLHRDGKEWQLQFLNRTDTERDNILAFLEARGTVESFDWTPPRQQHRLPVPCRQQHECQRRTGMGQQLIPAATARDGWF